jgi:hypothetical protein
VTLPLPARSTGGLQVLSLPVLVLLMVTPSVPMMAPHRGKLQQLLLGLILLLLLLLVMMMQPQQQHQ